MNRWGKNIFLVLLGVGLIGGGLVFLMSKNLSRPPQQKLPTSLSWKIFQAENPPFNFTFEYPELWKIKTSRFTGQFEMVSVLGPQEEKTKFVAAVFVTKKSLPEGKTIEQLAEDALNKKKEFPEFQILKKKEQKGNLGTLLGVEHQYVSMLPLYAPERQKTIVQSKELFLIKNNFYYRISFVGIQAQYKTFLPVFEHMTETFQFKD